ncbi:MAG TPA: hypothetical protein VK766_08520 [Cytophagaceae bacterium]|nr:hypothetical protein [Cytophagaceae bacterium]
MRKAKLILLGGIFLLAGMLSSCGEKECLGHCCDHHNCNNPNKPVPQVTPAKAPNVGG